MKLQTRLESAKEYLSKGLSVAKPSIDTPIWNIKSLLLVSIFEDIFMCSPSSDEEQFLQSELEDISKYQNTEYF